MLRKRRPSGTSIPGVSQGMKSRRNQKARLKNSTRPAVSRASSTSATRRGRPIAAAPAAAPLRLAENPCSCRGSASGRSEFAKAKSARVEEDYRDRKSTRLNSSHGYISYAVFCLKKKKEK